MSQSPPSQTTSRHETAARLPSRACMYASKPARMAGPSHAADTSAHAGGFFRIVVMFAEECTPSMTALRCDTTHGIGRTVHGRKTVLCEKPIDLFVAAFLFRQLARVPTSSRPETPPQTRNRTMRTTVGGLAL